MSPVKIRGYRRQGTGKNKLEHDRLGCPWCHERGHKGELDQWGLSTSLDPSLPPYSLKRAYTCQRCRRRITTIERMVFRELRMAAGLKRHKLPQRSVTKDDGESQDGQGEREQGQGEDDQE